MDDIVIIERNELDEAKVYANIALDRLNGPNYTGLHLPERFYVGRCGEIGFRRWATEHNLMFEDTVTPAGTPDEQDFLLYHIDGRTIKVNIKNSNHPRARYLMQPFAQAEKFKYDLYVGCTGKEHGDGLKLKLWGAISCQEFVLTAEVIQLKVLSRRYPLDELPISMTEIARKTKVQQR
jgi:hypothetical protein